jgi:hypothetical protein
MTNVLTAELTAPGGWLAAVIPGRLVVVHHPETDDEFVARLWAALCDDDGMRLVLDELTSRGLGNAPGFVLAEWNGTDETVDGRFIVRGGAGVALRTADGESDITAQGVSTWAERPVSGVTGFRIECLPAEPLGGPALPLAVGAAWVSSLSYGASATGFAAVSDGIRVAEWRAPAVAASAARPATASVAPASPPAAPRAAEAGPTAAAVEVPVFEPVPEAPVQIDDPDRTIADIEATVAGEDAAQPDPAPVADAPHETTGYDHLFGATLMRSIEDAAARPQQEEDGEAEAPASVAVVPPPASAFGAAASAPATQQTLGDHDGLTVMSGDLRAMREAASGAAPQQPTPLFGDVHRPAQAEAGFALQLPDGRTEPIDGMVVVGRAPSVSKIAGDRVPRLVTVDSVEHDISRNHVQLTIEGGTVVVTDLHSRNGTLIALPGKAPQKLRAGEPTSVIAGTVIDLGSGVTLGVAQA